MSLFVIIPLAFSFYLHQVATLLPH